MTVIFHRLSLTLLLGFISLTLRAEDTFVEEFSWPTICLSDDEPFICKNLLLFEEIVTTPHWQIACQLAQPVAKSSQLINPRKGYCKAEGDEPLPIKHPMAARVQQ